MASQLPCGLVEDMVKIGMLSKTEREGDSGRGNRQHFLSRYETRLENPNEEDPLKVSSL